MKCSFKYCNNDVNEESIRKVTKGYTKKPYCSLECANLDRRRIPKICELDSCCNFLTTGQKRFCSRSCSAVNSNTVSPKRQLEGVCESCGKPIKSNIKQCNICRRNSRSVYFIFDENLMPTINPTVCISDLPINKNSKYNYYSSKIRQLSRRYADYLLGTNNRSCSVCGYKYFTEICHIRPLTDESTDTLLKDIISFDNMVILCPNCHKEFDNGMISILGEIK